MIEAKKFVSMLGPVLILKASEKELLRKKIDDKASASIDRMIGFLFPNLSGCELFCYPDGILGIMPDTYPEILGDDEVDNLVGNIIALEDIPWESLEEYHGTIDQILSYMSVYKLNNIRDIYLCKDITGILIKIKDEYFVLSEDDLSEFYEESDRYITQAYLQEYPELVITDDLTKIWNNSEQK